MKTLLTHYSHEDEDYKLHFNNGITIDLVTEYDNLPPSLRIALDMNEEGVMPETLFNAGLKLQLFSELMNAFPEGKLEIIPDECLEYIYWISDQTAKTILNLLT